jgi:hypothetical protein
MLSARMLIVLLAELMAQKRSVELLGEGERGRQRTHHIGVVVDVADSTGSEIVPCAFR